MVYSYSSTNHILFSHISLLFWFVLISFKNFPRHLLPIQICIHLKSSIVLATKGKLSFNLAQYIRAFLSKYNNPNMFTLPLPTILLRVINFFKYILYPI